MSDVSAPASDRGAGPAADSAVAEKPTNHATVEIAWRRDLLTALPWLLVAVLAVVSLLRNEVALGEIGRYSVYWVLTIVLPGMIVVRSTVDRASFAENVIVGAAAGLVMQQVAWHGLRLVGLDALVTLWWLPIVMVGVAASPIRRRWWRRHTETLPVWWHAALAIVAGLLFMAIDVGGFRPNALPPADSTVYLDLWWHLAMVQELMRPGPAQVPQVVGEALGYHFNSHAHVAVGAQSAVIDPEVVLFRLWFVPLAALTLGSMAVVARRVSGSLVAGPLAAWLIGGALAGGFIWPNRLGDVAASPFVFLSPSQVIANVFMIVALGLAVDLVRGRHGRWHLAAFLVVAWAGLGAKPTVVPLLLAGLCVGMLAVAVTRRRWPGATLAIAVAGLVVLLASSLGGQNSSGSRLTLFGSLRGNRVYSEIIRDSSLRGTNEGLLLDSIDSARAIVAAVAAVIVLIGFHAVRLVGFALLARSGTRRDPAAWMLAGVVGAGWGAFFVLDHVGYSQAYFVHTAVPAGAVMAAWLFADAASLEPVRRVAPVVVAALGLGAITGSLALGASNGALAIPEAGMLVVVTVALLVVFVVAVATAGAWRALRARDIMPAVGGAVAVALVVGIALTPAASAIADRIVRFVHPGLNEVDASSPSFVSAGEQQAARWLRDNSDVDDVVATNLHCRPPSNEPVFCDARGYFVSGLSGRRIVLEGWAYTGEAQAMHGEGDRPFAYQPSPWPERYELSQAAVNDPTPGVLERLTVDYGADWFVAVRRADEVAPALFDLADLAFDNGEVAIFRLR